MENQPEDVESPHTQDPAPQRDSGSVSPQVSVPTPLKERGRDSSARQANNEGPRIRRSEREEFLVDTSKSKMKSSYALI